MEKGTRLLIYLALAPAFLLAAEAPNIPIIFNNQTSCELDLVFLNSYKAELSLPEKIASKSTLEGKIKFQGGFFSGTQQSATGQYIATCNNHRYPISFHFYIGYDDKTDDYRHFMETTMGDKSPIVIIPFGKITLSAHTSLNLSLVDENIVIESTNDEEAPPAIEIPLPNKEPTTNDTEQEEIIDEDSEILDADLNSS
jgi:hypothetical protein